jgi:hypothetical protein
MFVACECFVLSGRGLCVRLITRPEETYRVCMCVIRGKNNFNTNNEYVNRGPKVQLKKNNLLRTHSYVRFLFISVTSLCVRCVFVFWLSLLTFTSTC